MRDLVARAAAVILAAVLPAAAQEWSGQVTPYVWVPGLGGDITPYSGGPTLSFDRSLSEVLDETDEAFFLSGFARRDRLVILGDLSWSSSSNDGVLPGGLPAEGKVTQRSLTLLAGWRAVSNPDMTLDLLAGARAWRVEGDIAVAGGLISRSGRRDFVDPIIAARANFSLSPRWSALVYVDYGGFGAGSENTSQALITANYRMTDKLYLSGGFRQLSIDYRSGGTRLDVTMAGPLLGLTWRF